MVCVIRNCQPPELALAPTADREAADKAIAALTPEFTPGSAWAAVDLARNTLAGLRSPVKQILVFTDMQRSAWVEDKAPDRKAGGRSDIAIQFVAMQPRSRENCAIMGMEAAAPVTWAGRPGSH